MWNTINIIKGVCETQLIQIKGVCETQLIQIKGVCETQSK